ncbi:MAG: carbohydrate kinase family protein [Candidatus Methanofastidiosia archaeon]|jgi:ribokinase
MNVICIGNLNFDISFQLSALPDSHQKVRCDTAFFSCGGSAGNTACWLGSLGVHISMVGAVGNDPFGDAQIADLNKYTVDTTHVKKVNKSGIAVILVEKEAKRIIKFTGANQYKDITAYITQADHIHLSSNEKKVVETVCDICTPECVLSWDPQELFFEDLLPCFDYVFMNEDDLKRKTGLNTIKKAAKILDTNTLIVTKNGGGCITFGSTTIDIPSFGIQAVDTTGAGDAFDAGFIYGLHSSLPICECGITGTACASISVQHHGARGGICTRDQLIHFLRDHDHSFFNTVRTQ